MFHHFHGHGHPEVQGSISGEELAKIVEFLGDQLLDADEWLRRATAGSLEGKEICLTFDDNLRCQYDIALPILEKSGINAFWFIYTGPLEGIPGKFEIYRHFRTTRFPDVDDFYREFYSYALKTEHSREIQEKLLTFSPSRYLSQFPFYTEQDRRFRFIRDEILGAPRYDAIMAQMMEAYGYHPDDTISNLWMDKTSITSLFHKGHIIGLHSHTHPHNMGGLTAREQKDEYQKNYDIITRLTGDAPVCMAHPNNSYNGITLSILESLGITIGFRSNAGPVKERTRFEWPREDHANLIQQINGS